MPIRCLLVATDFSQPAERATRAGRLIAARTGARVILFHAVHPPALGRATPFFPVEMDTAQIVHTLREEARDRLRQARETHFPGDEPVTLLESPSIDAPGAIIDAAEAYQADLIVVGTHAVRGWGRMVSRSVAARLARTTPRPVLVVPAQARISHVLPSEVLVGVDFTPASVAALRWAGAWAAAIGAQLTLLHVSVYDGLTGPSDEIAADARSDDHQLWRLEAQSALRKLASEHVPATVPVSVEVRSAGDASHAIGLRAERGDDLVVIGAGASRRWRPSTTHRVLRRSPAPVVVIPEALLLGRPLVQPAPGAGASELTK